MIRTHDAGTLRAADAGATVTLAGWVARRRDHGGVIFLDLRDASGVVQVVFRDAGRRRTGCAVEFCVRGRRRRSARRPEGNANPELPTGEIEVVADRARRAERVRAAAVPDRRPRRGGRGGPAAGTATWTCAAPGRRARCGCAARSTGSPATCCSSAGFVEIETPTLTRSTPEGARDFLVPARLQPGHWYALPQSPQLFKQLLMVGRHGALLPDRPLLPRRGLPRRPAAGVHPARHRDDASSSRTTSSSSARRSCARLWRRGRRTRSRADPADDLRRRDGRATARTSPTCGSGSSSSTCTELLRGRPRSGCSRPPYVGAVVMPGGADAAPASSSTPGRSGPSSAARAGWPTCSFGDGRRARRPGRQEPLRRRARRPGRRRSAPSPGDCVFFAAGRRAEAAGAARRGPARDRPARAG